MAVTITDAGNSLTVTNATNSITFTIGRAGADGANGQGIAAGGTTGQTLVKASGTDYDTTWSNAGAGDMVAATYDPTTVAGDAFSMDSMVEGATTKILTATERSEIAANTAALHDAVTVVDSSEIDFTLTGQQITASLITGSIDETKLDASVNASLDLADSALQSFTETNDLSAAVVWANVPIANIPTGTTGVTVALGDHTHTGVYEPADATIVKDADIGSTVQAYSAALDAVSGTNTGDQTLPVSGVDFDPVGTDNSTDVTLAGTPDYITLVGQVLTRNQIDLAADVTGVLPIANVATGTPDGTKFVRDDGTLAVPAGGGSGDVVGPASATDNAIALYDGTTGKLISDSAITFASNVIQSSGATLDIKANAGTSGFAKFADTYCSISGPDGTDSIVSFDGSVDIITNNSTRISVTDLGMQLGGANARVTTIIDDDTMATASATTLATSESVKAYVDASGGLASTDIDTLAELNAIVTDATLIDTADARLSDARQCDNTFANAATAKTNLSLNLVENTALSTWAGTTSITTLGTITTGTWNGGVIASAYLTAATTSAAGISELATAAETSTGTDTGRTITPDALEASTYNWNGPAGIALGDETTAHTASTSVPVATFHAQRAITLIDIPFGCTTAPTGSAMTFDVHKNGTTIFSTKPTIDATEKHTSTAATPAVISTTAIAAGDLIEIFVDAVGATIAGAGAKAYFNAKHPTS